MYVHTDDIASKKFGNMHVVGFCINDICSIYTETERLLYIIFFLSCVISWLPISEAFKIRENLGRQNLLSFIRDR